MGKSRLVQELVADCGDEARGAPDGRFVPYGEGITFWPLTELVRQVASLRPRTPPDEAHARLVAVLAAEPEADLIARRLATATGLAEGETAREETFWAVRKLIEALAQDRPVVLVFDDVQWAEPTFLDLLDHLADRTRNARVLLVCVARPGSSTSGPCGAAAS